MYLTFEPMYVKRTHSSFLPSTLLSLPSGLVGLAISYALSVTSLLSGLVTSFTETEKEMVSVERALQYIIGAPSEPQEGQTEVKTVGGGRGRERGGEGGGDRKERRKEGREGGREGVVCVYTFVSHTGWSRVALKRRGEVQQSCPHLSVCVSNV